MKLSERELKRRLLKALREATWPKTRRELCRLCHTNSQGHYSITDADVRKVGNLLRQFSKLGIAVYRFYPTWWEMPSSVASTR